MACDLFRENKMYMLSILKFILPIQFRSWLAKKKSDLRQQSIRTKFKACASDVRFGRIERLYGPQYIKIGSGTCFAEGLFLTAWDSYPAADGMQDLGIPIMEIGEKCFFGAYNHLTCANKIVIGNGVLTGKWVTITDNSHGDTSRETLMIPPHDRRMVTKGPVVIEDNVWIGDKATILAGVSIGKGAVIGANTVVTKDIPPFCVAVGNSLRIIKKL